jgi:hypothetical protein
MKGSNLMLRTKFNVQLFLSFEPSCLQKEKDGSWDNMAQARIERFLLQYINIACRCAATEPLSGCFYVHYTGVSCTAGTVVILHLAVPVNLPPFR